MANQDPYQAPFDIDPVADSDQAAEMQQPADLEPSAEVRDPDLDAAEQAWIEAEWDAIDQQVAAAGEGIDRDASASSPEAHASDSVAGQDEQAISSPFVGRWHKLVSQTNWRKVASSISGV